MKGLSIAQMMLAEHLRIELRIVGVRILLKENPHANNMQQRATIHNSYTNDIPKWTRDAKCKMIRRAMRMMFQQGEQHFI